MKREILNVFVVGLVLVILTSMPLGKGESGVIRDNFTNAQNIESKSLSSSAYISNDTIWPMYCHDLHHTGRSPYNTTNNSGAIRWVFPLYGWGFYESASIGADGTIYVPANYYFYALHPDGTLKWQFGINGDSESCPALDDNGTIYFGTSWGDPSYFYAVSSNGTLKWKYWLGGGVYVKSSPAIGFDGTIYFGLGQSIIALFPNGTLRWQHSTGNVVYSSPAIGDDGTVYCGCHDTYLYALYPNNGTVKWKFSTGNWIRVSPCIGNDGTVYCVSLDEYLYSLYPNNGTMKWKTNVGAGTSPTIGPDGTIYAGWDILHAVDPTDGSIKWTFPAAYIEGGTPCTSSDGTIFFGTTGGDFLALSSNGTLLWKAHIGECQSAPAIGEDGTIYVGSMDIDGQGFMNAIGNGEPQSIEIVEPQSGRFYLFDHDLGKTGLKTAFIIGSETVKVTALPEDEILHVDFYIDGKIYFNDTTPPFEWKMTQRFGDKPLMAHTVTVTAFYSLGFKLTASVQIWLFHLF